MKTVERGSNDETHIKRTYKSQFEDVMRSQWRQPVQLNLFDADGCRKTNVFMYVYSMCIADSMSAHNIQEFSARLHGSRKGITNVKREEELPATHLMPGELSRRLHGLFLYPWRGIKS